MATKKNHSKKIVKKTGGSSGTFSNLLGAGAGGLLGMLFNAATKKSPKIKKTTTYK